MSKIKKLLIKNENKSKIIIITIFFTIINYKIINKNDKIYR